MTIAGRAVLNQYCDTVGDGSGDINAIGDYSASAVGFQIRPPPDRIYHISRMIVFCRNAPATAGDYGPVIGGLANGIRVNIRNDAAVLDDLTAKRPVKTSADWARLCYDAQVDTWGQNGGQHYFCARWSFVATGDPVALVGDFRASKVAPTGERLVVTLQDDLSSLTDHTFLVQGFAT